jgi:arylsulfatase A-like enzyme
MRREETEALGTKPNILWICTDQQRTDTLGCYGNGDVETPTIDALAAGGAQFLHCFAQAPVCTPSRASFLTGRYPRTTGCRQNGQDIAADEVLISRTLAEAGYSCGLAGKLHVSACHPRVAPVGERRVDDGYAEFHWSHHPGQDWPTNQYGRWLAEHGVEYRTPPFAECRHVRTGMPEAWHQTTWCAEQAIGFIRQQAGGKRPWLMSLNLFDPHHPFDPPAEDLRRWERRLDQVELPNYVPGELDDKPDTQRLCHHGAYGIPGHLAADAMTERDHRWLRVAYWAMCELIDRQMARVLDALEETGQRENTLVIFMSDHGELLGDHGIYLKGPFFYDPAVQVPLILSWPGVIPAGRHADLVELLDLAPTLLEAMGLPGQPGMQGRSLWSGLRSGVVEGRPDVYSEYVNAGFPPRVCVTMLRTERRKLVVHHGAEVGELYDLETDAAERHNRWDDPAYATDKMAMMQRLCDRMAWTADPLPLRRAPW